MTILPAQLLSKYGKLYPNAWEQAAQFRSDKGKSFDWPDYCFLPLAASSAIISGEATKQKIISHVGAPLPGGLVADVGNMGALLAWRMGQGVYRFDGDLYAALITTELNGDLPCDLLRRLPEWCVWVETPDDKISKGFFAYIECDANTGAEELRLVLELDGRLWNQPLHFSGKTILGAIDAAFAESDRQAKKTGHSLSELGGNDVRSALVSSLRSLIAPRVSLLLYLCTDEREIADEKSGIKRPMNPQPVPTKKGERLFAAASPTAWEVGMRVGAALRKAHYDATRNEPQGGTHARPRAHVRRPHWHTYLTGAGRNTCVLRWLHPILVNTEKPENLIPTLHKVPNEKLTIE